MHDTYAKVLVVTIELSSRLSNPSQSLVIQHDWMEFDLCRQPTNK